MEGIILFELGFIYYYRSTNNANPKIKRLFSTMICEFKTNLEQKLMELEHEKIILFVKMKKFYISNFT